VRQDRDGIISPAATWIDDARERVSEMPHRAERKRDFGRQSLDRVDVLIYVFSESRGLLCWSLPCAVRHLAGFGGHGGSVGTLAEVEEGEGRARTRRTAALRGWGKVRWKVQVAREAAARERAGGRGWQEDVFADPLSGRFSPRSAVLLPPFTRQLPRSPPTTSVRPWSARGWFGVERQAARGR
jgi:hypothetical protein